MSNQRTTLPIPRNIMASTRTHFVSIRLAATLAALLLGVTAADAQVVRRTIGGGGDVATIAEVQAEVAMADDGSLEVLTVLGAGERSETYKEVNLSRGDRILALNGSLLRTVADFKTSYEAASVGDTLELGVQRGDQRWIERFTKADPATLPRVRRMRIQGNPDDLALLMEIGVVFSREGDTLRVSNLLPVGPATESFREGDLFVSLNGEEGLKPAELQQRWQALAIGQEAQFTLLRDEAPVTFSLVKPEGHTGQRRVVRQ